MGSSLGVCALAFQMALGISLSQPGNRGPADVIAAADLGKRFLATVAALDRLAPLVRSELVRYSGHTKHSAFWHAAVILGFGPARGGRARGRSRNYSDSLLNT